MDNNWHITPKHYKIAEQNGISAGTLYNRVMYYGWDLETACTEKLRRQESKALLTEDVLKALEENDIKTNTFLARVSKLGWTVEKAMSTPTHTRKQASNKANADRRVISEEQFNIAISNGIKACTVRMRVFKYGWDVDKAINTPTMTGSEIAKSSYYGVFTNGQLYRNPVRYD